jgi:uncharacterized protein YndB with AHSA1/START domain
MKYICLGYIDPNKFGNMSETERNAMVDECLAYDDELRKNGHFAGGEGLQPPQTAATLWWRDGKVSITDGPYAETKEQIGGILILEARDLNHAIQLMSKHPGVKAGPFEIRPAQDLTDMIRESELRRAGAFHSSREIPASVEEVFGAFSDPERLARWWGPDGFTNTFEVCEFKEGGRWSFTMHGPNGANYPNESVFAEIDVPGKVVIRHVNEPKFQLTVTLAPSPTGTFLNWLQEFESPDFARSMAHILRPSNEQNLDRLSAEVLRK